MSPRARQQLYHSLAQLVRAGITFPQALEKLAKTARGSVRHVVSHIRSELAKGRTVAEACASADLGSTEAAVLAAVERTGSLDRGLEQLAAYFGAMARAGSKIRGKLAYPLFVLVLGVLLLNLTTLVRAGLPAYLAATLPVLVLAVVGLMVLALGWSVLSLLSAVNPVVDGLVRFLPMVGRMHRSFAMGRFCMIYELQLEAGINVMTALQAAGVASRSSLVKGAVRRVVPEVRGGSAPGPLLAVHTGIEPEVAQAIMVGEETGNLGAELRRVAEEQTELAFRRLDAVADWLPRLIHLGVLLYVGWMIVSVYRDYLNQVMSVFEGM